MTRRTDTRTDKHHIVNKRSIVHVIQEYSRDTRLLMRSKEEKPNHNVSDIMSVDLGELIYLPPPPIVEQRDDKYDSVDDERPYVQYVHSSTIDGRLSDKKQSTITSPRLPVKELVEYIKELLMERGIESSDIKILTSEILKKIKERAGESPSPDDILYAHHVHDVFQAHQQRIPFEKFIQQTAQSLQNNKGDIFVHQPKPETRGEAADLSEIPQWRGRKQDGNPLEFIKAHYGQWLSGFGAEQDAIFQDQIRKHDSALIKGIHNQLREEGQGRKVRDFIKPRSARLDRELAHITVEDLKMTPRLASTLYSRQRRAQEAKATATSHTVPTNK